MGCDRDPPTPWHERNPDAFPASLGIVRCPMSYIKEHDPERDAMISTYQDYETGNVVGWPDRFTASTVEGVRYTRAQVQAASAEMMEASR